MAFYPIFKMVMKSVQTSMHAMRLAGDRKVQQPDHIDKVSYYYTLEDDHQCNVYRRNDTDSSNAPLIIDIHGGCWIYGDKDYYDAFSYEMVDKGFNVTSLTYQTKGRTLLKHQIQDIFSYLHFLEDNAKHIGISLERIMLTGDSAGGQLSLLTYAINQDPYLQEIFDVKPVSLDFSCMVLTHPVCFIDSAAAIVDNDFISHRISTPGLKRMLYGFGYEFRPEYHRSVTPERYITDEIKLTPIMIVTSKGDQNFLTQSERLADFFDDRNIPYTYFYEDSPEAGHVYNISEPHSDYAKLCNQEILSFFNRSLPEDKQFQIPDEPHPKVKVIPALPAPSPSASTAVGALHLPEFPADIEAVALPSRKKETIPAYQKMTAG